MARKNILNRAVAATVDSPAVPAVEFVTVRALGWIGEDGITYKPGETFQTTPRRAASLGKQVEILG
jgi:hypothetical protein